MDSCVLTTLRQLASSKRSSSRHSSSKRSSSKRSSLHPRDRL
jgi:hypothetical protein